MRLFVDYSWFGHSTRVTVHLTAAEMTLLSVGDHVILEGDSVPDRRARVTAILAEYKQATCEMVDTV